jgi:hypothetical protein
LHRAEEIPKTGFVHFTRPTFSSRIPSPDRQTSQPGRRRARVTYILATAAAVALAACATERGDKRRLLERVAPPQPLLSAAAAFDHGALEIQAWLGPSVRLRKEGGPPGAPRGEPRGEGHRGRGGDSSSAPSEYFGYVSGPFEAGDNSFSAEEIDEMYGRKNFQYILPPRLALTLTVANRSAQTITLAVADVNSTLGNFAPRPEKLVLAPGQQASVDPMLSTFENNFEELDVSVTIKCENRPETQVLKLQRAAPPAPAAPGKPPRD